LSTEKKFNFNLNLFLDNTTGKNINSNNNLRQFLGDEKYFLRVLESMFDDLTYKIIFPKPAFFIATDSYKLKTTDVIANYSFSLKDSLFKAEQFDDENYDSKRAKGFFIEQDNSSCAGLMFNDSYNFFIQSFAENTTCNSVNSKHNNFNIADIYKEREYDIEDDLTIKSSKFNLDIKGRVKLVKLQKKLLLFTPGDLQSEYYGRIKLLANFFKKYKLEQIKESYYEVLFDKPPEENKEEE
jgi:hypothetical protein